MLFKFGKATSPRCSACKVHDETIMHLFHDCLMVKIIRNQLKFVVSNNLILPISMPQSAIFGFWDLHTNEHLILTIYYLFSKCTFTMQEQRLLEYICWYVLKT